MPDKLTPDQDLDDDLTVDVADAGARVRGGRLQAVGGGAALRIGDEVQVIGRSRHCALFVDDETVSKLQVEVQATPLGVRFKDLDSRNGTFLEGSGVAIRFAEVYLVGPWTVRLGHNYRLRFTPELLAPAANPEVTRFGGLLGTTPAMLALFVLLQRHADSVASVLISGETGTGKERVARAIHDASARRLKPFVARNCAELAAYSLEDDLFGHVRGAFTGADRDRAGAFVEADGGTLFLDEVAEMGPPLQAKLLRVLQEKEIRPLGSDKSRPVNVRCLFATNVDLNRAIEKGAFRDDLYFRMTQGNGTVPPLRTRLGDLPLWVHDILQEINRPEVSLDDGAISELMAHEWPGNVRELHNVIARALPGLSGTMTISKPDVLAALPSTFMAQRLHGSYPKAKEGFDREYYTRLFVKHKGNVTQIAKESTAD